MPPPAARKADPARRPRTRSEELAAALSREILSGALEPGSRLDEHSLARRFGVSRTPVREALKHLAGLDLITIRPHRGAVVSRTGDAPAAELFEALAEAEAACARLAALKMSEGGRERLVAMHRAYLDAAADTDHRPARDLNRLFHEAVHLGARNPFLAEAAQTLRRRLAPHARAPFATPERPAASAREHGAVLAAILDRDGPAAAEAMRRHVAEVGRAWAEGA